jgi:hypothetical protein
MTDLPATVHHVGLTVTNPEVSSSVPLGTPPMRENRAVARRRRCFLAQVRP